MALDALVIRWRVPFKARPFAEKKFRPEEPRLREVRNG